MNPDHVAYSAVRANLGIFTEFDGCLDPIERRNRHLRKCRVMAGAGLSHADYCAMFSEQKLEFPQLRAL